MSMKNTLLVVVLLTLLGARASGADSVPDSTPRIRGTVIDCDGHPCARAQVGMFWTPNDWFDDSGKRRNVKDPSELKKYWTNTGRMRPSIGGVVTDDLGHFVLPKDRTSYGVLAYDARQQNGGIATLHDDNMDLEIRLQPLLRLHGKLRLAESGSIPEWSYLDVCLPEDDRRPLAFLRVAGCGSWDGEFSLLLPPGEYKLDANTEDSEILDPTLTVKLTETKQDYDLGTLLLYPHVSLRYRIKDAKRRGEWGDYTKSFGKTPPPWHVVAARGISPRTRPSDLRGKWTLIYFFSCYCVPCLADGLPRATAFCEANRDKRKKFEIIGFCIDDLGNLSTNEKLERKLQSLVKNVWNGKDLPFPLMLDNTLTTWKTYGFSGLPTELLIDPEGKLAKGGLKELAEKVGASMPRH
jgi:hypothetical protein